MADPPDGVAFAKGDSGSRALHRIAEELTSTFPELTPAPSSRLFRKLYHDWLPEFEASRLMSPRRGAIAVRAAQLFIAALRAEGVPLSEAYSAELPAAELRSVRGSTAPALRLPFASGVDLRAATDEMWTRGQCSRAVVDAVEWAYAEGPQLDLSNEHFVLMGAGAQLAPTELLLRGGANVLWIDVRDPSRKLQAESAGALHFAPGGLDLLQSPATLRATIEAFAPGPVHLGLFAYAGGGAREWRLCGTMNALVDALAPSQIKSVSLLLSPASPCTAAPFQAQAPTRTLEALPKGRGGTTGAVARNVVPVQGVSYQAAQYLGKRLTVEAWAQREPAPFRISANMAGITRTRSTEHPVFEAAFSGAHRLGVRIFEPEFTSHLCAWLMLHDLFGPDEPQLFEKQVHGGVLGLPVSLKRAITTAATLGLATRPRLIGKLLARR